jgi:hypothetical protein
VQEDDSPLYGEDELDVLEVLTHKKERETTEG